MAIRFTCPAGHRLKVPDEKAGRGMLCPICQESVTVPEVELAEPDPHSPEPPPVDTPEPTDPNGPPPLGEIPAIPVPVPAPPAPASSARVESSPLPTAAASRPYPIPWGVATGLLIVLAYSALPAFGHLRDTPMPVWVRILLGAVSLQAVFVLWMLTARHWVAMAIVTLLFALASIGYATVAAFAFAPRGSFSIPWGIEPIRSRAAVWSATVLALYLLATYSSWTAAVRQREDTHDQTAG